MLAARRRAYQSREALEQVLQTAALKGKQENVLVGMVAELMSMVSDVERAWRVNVEQQRHAADSAENERDELRVRVQRAEADAKRSKETLAATLREGDERVNVAMATKNAEQEVWKTRYTQQMREYLDLKLSEARASAAKDHAASVEAAIGRIEAEYKARALVNAQALQEARTAELAARREATEARNRAEAAELRVATLTKELVGLRGTLSAAEARAGSAGENARQLAEEVLRLQRALEIERKAHPELLRLSDLRHKTELEAAATIKSSAIASREDAHQEEMMRTKQAFDAALKSREDELAAWRAKYAAAAQRAAVAEGLLREIDRQLAPA